METSTYTTTVLTAAPGCMLTEAADPGILNRTITDKAYLAVNDSPDNWREISAEEAEALRAEQEQARKELEEAERQAEMEERSGNETA